MIDEELYQQAADELNSDRRRPHIWARACALASDDHDEARYLYTNLRVEELLSERAKKSEAPDDPAVIENDSTLALTPIDDDEDDEDEVRGFLDDMQLDDEEIPSSIPAPSGVDQPGSKIDPMQLEPLNIELENSDNFDTLGADPKSIVDELIEPDPELMADYVPESHVPLDDTYADDGLAAGGLEEEDFVQELETFKAEHDDTSDYSDTGVFTGADSIDDKDFDLDSNTSLNLSEDDIAQIQSGVHEASTDASDLPLTANFIGDETADLTDVNLADLTQSNMDVLDAHTSELDEMLEDARYKPAEPEPSEPEMQWLEEEDSLSTADTGEADDAREPTIIDADAFTDELTRQADELDLQSDTVNSSGFDQDPVEEISSEPEVAEPASAASTAAASTAAASTAAATTAAAAAMVAAAPNLPEAGSSEPHTDASPISDPYPLDLTEGRKGKLFSVYRRDNQTQAVKSGVSWSALFLTLPYLIYRHLFGTALAYLAVWIVAIGGLIVSGLAWLDAGTEVTPLIQACTIGFALLAFIGLVYLPFRYANHWRSEKLEDRGFELVALAKAKNPGKAIATTRRYAAIDG